MRFTEITNIVMVILGSTCNTPLVPLPQMTPLYDEDISESELSTENNAASSDERGEFYRFKGC
jgi:hypothetical protein